MSGSMEVTLPTAYDDDDLEVHLIHEVVLSEPVDEDPVTPTNPDEEMDDEDSGLPSISFIAVLSVIMVAAFTAQRKLR